MDDTILQPSRWPKSPYPFWTEVHGWYNPTTISMTEITGSILNQGSRMIQSYNYLDDRNHQFHFGPMSRDDTIPLHSWGPRSPDHFRESSQGWYNPTTTSLLPLSGKVFPNHTKIVSKVFELYSGQRLVSTSTTCSSVLTYWSFMDPFCIISQM